MEAWSRAHVPQYDVVSTFEVSRVPRTRHTVLFTDHASHTTVLNHTSRPFIRSSAPNANNRCALQNPRGPQIAATLTILHQHSGHLQCSMHHVPFQQTPTLLTRCRERRQRYRTSLSRPDRTWTSRRDVHSTHIWIATTLKVLGLILCRPP